MRQYLVTEPVQLFTGIIGLDDKQASARLWALEPVLDPPTIADESLTAYRILRPTTFKAGERFMYDGVIPKGAVASLLTEPDSEPVSKPRKTRRKGAG